MALERAGATAGFTPPAPAPLPPGATTLGALLLGFPSFPRFVQIKGGTDKNLPRSGVRKHREAAGSASSPGICSHPQGGNGGFPSGGERGERGGAAGAESGPAPRRSPRKCFQLPSPESRRAPYTCNYPAKRLRAQGTAELVLLPTQHKEALTSTQQPTCTGEGNNYIFILSFRHLLPFLHTAAEGWASTDGSRSEDRHGGRCRERSKHPPAASLLDMVLAGHPLGRGGPSRQG